MGADVAFHPGQGNKTPFFQALDSIGNTASARQLEAFREKLIAGVPLLQIYEAIDRRQTAGELKDKAHVGEHWLATGDRKSSAWWPQVDTEQAIRKGIIEVIGLQLETSPPRKVDYWWIASSEGFRFVPCVKAHRVIVIVITPYPPRVGLEFPGAK
jgi:hypothetical protein